MTQEDINKAIASIRSGNYADDIRDASVNVIIGAIKNGFTLCPEEEPEDVKDADAENLKKLSVRFREAGDREGDNIVISAAAAIVDYKAKYHAARKNLLKVLKGERL